MAAAVASAATWTEQRPGTEGARTRGGDFFYRLHFDLHYIPVLGALPGRVLRDVHAGGDHHRRDHHKKIFKDFFTFRTKGLRSWPTSTTSAR